MSGNTESIARSAKTRRKPRIGGMSAGVDSQIDEPFDLRPDGTTRTKSEAIVDFMRQGDFLETAAGRVGLNNGTPRDWLRTAARARIRQQVNPTTQLTPKEQKSLIFTNALEQAEADFEAAATSELDQIARGGRRINIIREHRTFKPGGPEQGILVSRDTEVRTLPPDPRVLQWRLEKRFPGRYTPQVRIETVEAALSPDEVTTALADEIEAFCLGAKDGADAAKAEKPQVDEVETS